MSSGRISGAKVLLAGIMLACGGAAAAANVVEGFTEPSRKIDVAPAETGTITSLAVREGDAVRQGQQLGMLDTDVLAVSLEIAKAAADACGKLKSAAAERDLRRTRWERLAELRLGGHASQEEVDRARADLAVAEAGVLAAGEQHRLDELEYKKTRAMIERRTIRSPIDGTVVKIYREQQEYVSSNNAAVFTVVQLSPLRVVFSVPTAQAVGLKVGQSVKLLLPDGGQHAAGTVQFIAPLTDAESGTVRVKVLLDNSRGKYACGVRCTLQLGPVPAVPGKAALTVGTSQTTLEHREP